MKGWMLLRELAALSVDELNLDVHIEGCDCTGKANGVVIDNNHLNAINLEESLVILIKRSDD